MYEPFLTASTMLCMETVIDFLEIVRKPVYDFPVSVKRRVIFTAKCFREPCGSVTAESNYYPFKRCVELEFFFFQFAVQA